MPCTFTFLGTGTCELKKSRIASSVLIEFSKWKLLFDVGYGVAHRLAECGVTGNQIEHIYLSHFHPDHVSDLIPLLHDATWSRQAPRVRELSIYGPAGTQDFVKRLLSLFGSESLVNDKFRLHVHELPGGKFSIGENEFELFSLPPAGNHGLLFKAGNCRAGISGDSGEVESLKAFLNSCDVAIIDIGHLQKAELVSVIADCSCQRIYGTHIYEEYNEVLLKQELKAAGYKGNFSIAADRDCFNLPSQL